MRSHTLSTVHKNSINGLGQFYKVHVLKRSSFIDYVSHRAWNQNICLSFYTCLHLSRRCSFSPLAVIPCIVKCLLNSATVSDDDVVVLMTHVYDFIHHVTVLRAHVTCHVGYRGGGVPRDNQQGFARAPTRPSCRYSTGDLMSPCRSGLGIGSLGRSSVRFPS